MTVYKNCEMEVYYATADAKDDGHCEVRLTKGSIAVSYSGEEGPVVYEGEESSPGHYKLQSTSPKGAATLHKSSNSNVLEGWWSEDGEVGMWRIFIEE